MAQKSYYNAESFDIAYNPLTYTAAGLGSAKFTVGTTYYTRLDSATPAAGLNGFLSLLWSKGSGTTASVLLGLYAATGTATAGVLYQVGVTADQGAVASGLIRVSLGTLTNQSTAAASYGEQVGNPQGTYYAALLVKTDAGTNHVDAATSATYLTNEGVSSKVATDQTPNLGLPRCFIGAGTSLTALPASEALSGVTTSAILPWFGLD